MDDITNKSCGGIWPFGRIWPFHFPGIHWYENFQIRHYSIQSI